MEDGVPTYGYDLAQAVKDGYLVDYLSIETKLKFIEEGIVYDDLSEADKQVYEDTFEDENGELPEKIASSALNKWIFNEDTIRQALHVLMTNGLTIDYGSKLGKTIIFAKNHNHAEKILEIFPKHFFTHSTWIRKLKIETDSSLYVKIFDITFLLKMFGASLEFDKRFIDMLK